MSWPAEPTLVVLKTRIAPDSMVEVCLSKWPVTVDALRLLKLNIDLMIDSLVKAETARLAPQCSAGELMSAELLAARETQQAQG